MLVIDTSWHPLIHGCPPEWASAWGQDRFGVWVDVEFESPAESAVVQRLRWLPPGRFMMGSPPKEPGRREDEGPRHAVAITKGFWLFDTPVTQALWEHVMGDNPSRFRTPDRPVEQVTWHACQEFVTRTNELKPGLDLEFPTEAQWEYACRAGTKTALYTGPIDIQGRNNAPALDPIAWYGGNCGVEFELKNGFDTTTHNWWKEKQFEFTHGGSHPVKQKLPNEWGLYDMLGNVWEWCSDWFGDYVSGLAIDPTGPPQGSQRVLRGGSWSGDARYVRPACRLASDPGDRSGRLGLRCARIQAT